MNLFLRDQDEISNRTFMSKQWYIPHLRLRARVIAGGWEREGERGGKCVHAFKEVFGILILQLFQRSTIGDASLQLGTGLAKLGGRLFKIGEISI